MRARSRTTAGGINAGVVALVITACTSASNPGTLGRAEQVPSDTAAETLPPVTTAAPPRTTSTDLPTTLGSGPTTVDSASTTEQPPPSNLEVLEQRLLATLGPTDDLGQTVRSVVAFPAGVATPDNADIVEMSIGSGSPTGDGTAPTQVSVSLTTSLDGSAAFDQMASSLQSAGMFTIDTTSEGDIRSGAFRLPTVNLFDEVVVTTAPNLGGSSMRVTSNSNLRTDQLRWFIDWAGEPLPLPESDDQRTLIVVTTGGSGRLRVVDLTLESVAIVEAGSAQREANRLISRLEGSDRIGFDGDPSIDQPLSGSLIFDELDSLEYSVAPSTRTEVGRDGEPAEIEVVEIRLRGMQRLSN